LLCATRIFDAESVTGFSLSYTSYGTYSTAMKKYILFFTCVLLSKFTLLTRAEIFPGKRHPELNSQPDRWNQDSDSFDMVAALPALGNSASAFGLFSFLNKRQFGDCPSGAPIEVTFIPSSDSPDGEHYANCNSAAASHAVITASQPAAAQNAVLRIQLV
jgi:hypothetical protein